MKREPNLDRLSVTELPGGALLIRRPDGPPSVWTRARLLELIERAQDLLWDTPVTDLFRVPPRREGGAA